MTEGLALLRVPFPPNQISKLPKPKSKDAVKGRCQECGGWHGLPAVHLDYVGHAALTDRLLDADPSWTWEPLSMAEGLPVLDGYGGMWIRLTVCGVTRLGYGHAGDKSGGDAIKEVIGDALRNAAMRFGAALDLWHKGDLHADDGPRPETEPKKFETRNDMGEPIAGFSPAKAKVIRMAAQNAIQKFNEGDEMACYEEVSSVVDRYGVDPDGVISQDLRNNVLLALSSIFQPHSALRASLKKHMEADRKPSREAVTS